VGGGLGDVEDCAVLEQSRQPVLVGGAISRLRDSVAILTQYRDFINYRTKEIEE
jgi:hypothetical protein